MDGKPDRFQKFAASQYSDLFSNIDFSSKPFTEVTIPCSFGSVSVNVDGKWREVSPEELKAAYELYFSVNPDEPTNLAGLANLLRRDNPRKHRVIRLLEHMHLNERATYAELREHVHEGYDADDSTVKRNIEAAKTEIRNHPLVKARLTISRMVLTRTYISE